MTNNYNINFSIKHMIAKLKDKFFKSHKACLNYMAKVFANECEFEPKVDNLNFKTTTKGSKEQRIAVEISEIEKLAAQLGFSARVYLMVIGLSTTVKFKP